MENVYNLYGEYNCRGLVPRVPWVVGYGPKIWIRSVPFSGKGLGNQTPCIGYGATTPGSI
jgi:hypothetical protein